MIVCSSDVTDLMEVCTRVIALRNGEIVGYLQLEEITEDAITAVDPAQPSKEPV